VLGACSTVSDQAAPAGRQDVTSADDRNELADLRQVATADERFQSYNVEMVEVTGGRFWITASC
jgi:hypothetical protein